MGYGGRNKFFSPKWLGSNNEGEVDCIAQLPVLVSAKLLGDHLTVSAFKGSQIKSGPVNPLTIKSHWKLKNRQAPGIVAEEF
jgi:hypothetical protein